MGNRPESVALADHRGDLFLTLAPSPIAAAPDLDAPQARILEPDLRKAAEG